MRRCAPLAAMGFLRSPSPSSAREIRACADLRTVVTSPPWPGEQHERKGVGQGPHTPGPRGPGRANDDRRRLVERNQYSLEKRTDGRPNGPPQRPFLEEILGPNDDRGRSFGDLDPRLRGSQHLAQRADSGCSPLAASAPLAARLPQKPGRVLLEEAAGERTKPRCAVSASSACRDKHRGQNGARSRAPF